MSTNSNIDEWTCAICKRGLPTSEYHVERRSVRGHRDTCKECANKQARDWYHKNRQKKLANSEVYRKKNWEQIKINAYKRLDPQKQEARKSVYNAVKRGTFVKESCYCGEVKTDFHHSEGYEKDKWFTGVWLCRPHHAEEHRRLRWNQ